MANQIARRQIQLCRKCAEHACPEERMQLLAENGFVYVAVEPRAGHRSQSQVFHARHKTANGAVPLNKINDGNEEVIAG
jgi:hypothetical protein